MENKILELFKSGKNSQEISIELQLDKKEIDIILINNYIKLHPKYSCLRNIYDELNYNPQLSYVYLSNKYGINSRHISYLFHSSGVYIYRKFINTSKNITKQQVYEMFKLYKKGFNKNKIGQIYNISVPTITRLFKKYNITYKNCNEHIFDIIDTEEKAYWLGFLYADGSLSKNNYDIDVDLKVTDINHLIKLKKFLDNRSSIRVDEKLQRCRFQVSNKYLHDQLIKLNCTPNKSLTLKFPDESIFTDKSLIRHFIRGYFDGDGSLSYSGTKICYPRVNFIGTIDFLKQVEYYTSNIKWRYIHDKRHKDITWSIWNKDRNDAIIFLNWLYDDATIYLDRKYLRFLYFKQNYFAVRKSDFSNYNQTISENDRKAVLNYFPNFKFKQAGWFRDAKHCNA